MKGGRESSDASPAAEAGITAAVAGAGEQAWGLAETGGGEVLQTHGDVTYVMKGDIAKAHYLTALQTRVRDPGTRFAQGYMESACMRIGEPRWKLNLGSIFCSRMLCGSPRPVIGPVSASGRIAWYDHGVADLLASL